jgi:hypothetical protein
MRTTIKASIIGLLLVIAALIFAHRYSPAQILTVKLVLTAPTEVSACDNST